MEIVSISCPLYLRRERIMGYFAEQSMEIGNGFEPVQPNENDLFQDGMDEELSLPVNGAQPKTLESIQPFELGAEDIAVTLPAGFEDDAAQQAEADSAPAVLEKLTQGHSEDAPEEDDSDGKEEKPEPAKAPEADERTKRAEHEAAEAKRKAEWDAKQAVKKAAEQEALARLAAMSDADVMKASTARVGKDTEKLTRRNMKDCVAEYIQTKCLDDPAFARLAMHPKKNMIRCFHYINRQARKFVEQELKDNDQKPESGVYGSDVPDDLCYQWAEDYFRDPYAEEDKDGEKEFVPKPYYGGSKGKKAAKKPEKKTEAKKPEAKKANDGGQMSLLDQPTLFDMGLEAKAG